VSKSRTRRSRTCLNLAPDIQKIFLDIENKLFEWQVVWIIAEGLLDFHGHMLLYDRMRQSY
jgi:hypothetical protein